MTQHVQYEGCRMASGTSAKNTAHETATHKTQQQSGFGGTSRLVFAVYLVNHAARRYDDENNPCAAPPVVLITKRRAWKVFILG